MPTNNYENRSVVVRVPDFGIARGQDGLSAYEQAVAGGYEGTEAQFNQELSSFKTLHDETETAATAAAESATSAGQSAIAAAGSAESAASSASSSATSAADASASAGSAADFASSAASSAASAAASAASAGNSASTATQKASEASASATAASASETNAASSEDAAADSAAAAAASAAAIEEYEHDAEAWAIGKRGGQDVPSTDETYHNNAKYYAEQAGTSASAAASSASAASASESNAAASASSAAGSASSATTSAATATDKAGEASTSASEASTSATSAAGSATNAASSATAASASATAAGNAQTAAETAQGKAEDAQAAAEQAQSDAEAAAQSVSQSAAQISQNASDISDLKSAFETYTPHNLYDYTKNARNKYLNPNGVMEDYNGRYVTDYIQAVPGKYIVCSYIASNKVTRTNYSAICCFDENKNVVPGGDYNKPSFLVPNGVAFVRITVSGTMNTETAMIENSNDTNPTTFEFFSAQTDFLSRDTIIYPTKMGFMSAKSALSDGERIDLPYHNVKNENVIAFTANITSFSSLKIGKSNDAIVTVDSTNIIVHSDQGDFTEAHGLTIENNLQILITNKTSINADVIRVTSNGISHTVTGIHRFLMDEGNPFVESVGSALTDAVLSWTSRNINKPIWLFGDSYFSWYSSRWTYYLAEDGFTESCMLNGYPGETVQYGMSALRSLLNVKTPDYVVWCLGMNNGDETAVSPSWKLAYDELVGLANSYGFELILATIPNTPTVNNTFKNDVVKNSGYRYIDFSNAVNVPNSNTWYSGMLSNDNVHPTVQGAKSLYGQVLADFPEITSI